MAEAQVTENDAEQGSNGSSLKHWIAGIGAVTALLVAVTGLIHALTPTEKSGKQDSHVEAISAAPPASSKVVNLLWVPADCSEGARPAVAIGSCKEARTLEWLRTAIDELRQGKKYGFDAMSSGFTLNVGSSGSHTNYRLDLVDSGGSFSVGVGYNIEKKSKDGGLHIARNGRIIANAWLRDDNSWSDSPN